MPVLVNGNYYSDGERCSHCGEPFPERQDGRVVRRKHTICKPCQRHHIDRRYSKGRFYFNANCKACLATMPEEHSLGTL